MSDVLPWLMSFAGLLVLGAGVGWLLHWSQRRNRVLSVDELSALSRYRLPMGARVMAGLLALIGLAAMAVNYTSTTKWGSLGMAMVAVLLLYGAVTGRSPAWLESDEEANSAVDRLLARWRNRK